MRPVVPNNADATATSTTRARSIRLSPILVRHRITSGAAELRRTGCAIGSPYGTHANPAEIAGITVLNPLQDPLAWIWMVSARAWCTLIVFFDAARTDFPCLPKAPSSSLAPTPTQSRKDNPYAIVALLAGSRVRVQYHRAHSDRLPRGAG